MGRGAWQWGVWVPKRGWAPASPGIKVKAENKPAGITARPQGPASLSLKAPGKRGAEGGSGGQQDTPCLGQAQPELLPAKGAPGMLLSQAWPSPAGRHLGGLGPSHQADAPGRLAQGCWGI